MSSIDKLLIRGIRSFDPHSSETISFQKPLTLIVGHNGSGKTTIIECLKFATTGDQPPNTKGGAFVHDPKLAEQTEVKGQVKLKFTNVKGRTIVCTRSLQASQTEKASKISGKTLESLLLIKDEATDQNYALSSTCAEIDQEMPNHLGVSKAILDNVIFCHQEESFWPLSEPGVLKKRFDEIFAATRYTKALDNIKSIRKKTLIEMKSNKVQLDNDKLDKTRAQKLRKQINELDIQIEEANARILDLDENEMVSIPNEINRLQKTQYEVNKSLSKVDQLSSEMVMVSKGIDSLSQTAHIMKESDAELQAMVDEYQDAMNRQSGDQERLEKKRSEILSKSGALQKEQGERQALLGLHQAEFQVYQARLAERAEMVRELVASLNFGDFNCDSLTEFEVKRFVDRIKEELGNKTEAARTAKVNMRDGEKVIHAELQSLQSKYTGLSAKKNMLKQQLDQTNDQILRASNAIQQMPDSIEELEVAQEGISRVEVKVSRAKQAIRDLDAEVDSDALSNELQDNERKAQRIRDEMASLNLQGESRARLGLKKSDRNRKSVAYDNLISKIRNDVETQTKRPFNQSSLEYDIQKCVQEKEDALKQLQDRKRTRNAENSANEAKLALTRSALDEKTRELDSKLAIVRAVCGGKLFEDYKKEAESNIEINRETSSSVASAVKLYSRFIISLNENHTCSLCTRPFASETEEIQFLHRLENITTRAPATLQKSQEELDKWQTILNRLNEIHSVNDDCTRLSEKEIPEIKKRRDELDRERMNQFTATEQLDHEVSLVQAELQHARSLKERAQEIMLVWKEMQQLDGDIRSLSGSMASLDGAARTVEDAQRDYDELQSKSKVIRAKLDRYNADLKFKTQELSTLDSQLRDLKERKQMTEYQAKEKQKMKDDLLGLQRQFTQLGSEISVVEAQAGDYPRQIEAMEIKLARYQNQAATDEDVAMKAIQLFSTSLNKIMTVQRDISRYIDARLENKISNIQEEMKGITDKMKTLTQDHRAVQEKLTLLQKEASQVQLTQRNIADNLQLRRFRKDREKLELEISKLKVEISKFDKKAIDQEIRKTQLQLDSLTQERAETIGAVKQKEESRKSPEKTLTSEYNNIEKRYEEHKYRYVADELAMNDLEKYSKALEEGIQKFHSLKMVEINKIIRELWTKTYKGNDIDTIEIRSEPESKANNKSFQYRVVMIRGETEMDMRGRCSAGQKVLASIIVRLALAETFCLACGILALDEPTTNLDEDNVAGLAQSLADIIDVRQAQSNFQLIIITHDETFVTALGSHAEKYYRVAKNNKGCSTITPYSTSSGEEI